MSLPVAKPTMGDLVLDAHRSIETTAREIYQMRAALKHMLFQLDQREEDLKLMLEKIEENWPSEEEQTG